MIRREKKRMEGEAKGRQMRWQQGGEEQESGMRWSEVGSGGMVRIRG